MAAAGWLGVRASRSATVKLDAGPSAEVYDMPVHLAVEGLYRGAHVTVQALAQGLPGGPWTSWAAFTAGASGRVDLARSVPEAGTYQVADAGGLLWSLQPSPSTGPIAGFGDGFTVQVRVLVGGEVAAEQTLTRSMPASSQDMHAAQAGFDGSLYRPANLAANTPAVVVIGGSEGGIPNWIASAFAGAGYPTLALGYFGAPGLPACLCSIPLEYFAHAVAWLRAQPGFATRPVVLWGASRGGEGGLVLAAYEPNLFDAVVAVSPSDQINGAYGPGSGDVPSAWTLNGQPLTPGMIPVAQIRVPVLLTAGGQDIIWYSAQYAASVMRQLDAAPGAPAHRFLSYPDAGHSMAGVPPYRPIDPDVFGGTKAADARAAADAWPQVLAFIGGTERHHVP